jgi:transposase-like protein
MSGKRRKYTPEFREQAARLVIETGRPVAHVAAEIGVGEQVLGRWVRLAREAADAGDMPGCLMLMNARSWSVCAGRMPHYGWTVRF